MDSLAQLVVLLFTLSAVTGPLACLFAWMRLPVLTSILGVCATFCGLIWFETAPWPVGAVGLVNAFLGLAAGVSVWRGNHQ